MDISSISSTSLGAILSLVNKSTSSGEELSLESKITGLQSTIQEMLESGESGNENSSVDSGTDSAADSSNNDSSAGGSADTSAIEEMQAQSVQFQVRLAQMAGQNVKTNMQEQFDALNNNTALNKINDHLMNIIS